MKDVVATNEDKKLESEEDLDQHFGMVSQWKWKSSVNILLKIRKK